MCLCLCRQLCVIVEICVVVNSVFQGSRFHEFAFCSSATAVSASLPLSSHWNVGIFGRCSVVVEPQWLPHKPRVRLRQNEQTCCFMNVMAFSLVIFPHNTLSGVYQTTLSTPVFYPVTSIPGMLRVKTIFSGALQLHSWAPPGMGKGGHLPPLEMCKWVFETPVRNF